MKAQYYLLCVSNFQAPDASNLPHVINSSGMPENNNATWEALSPIFAALWLRQTLLTTATPA